jgi:hypothetical protein
MSVILGLGVYARLPAWQFRTQQGSQVPLHVGWELPKSCTASRRRQSTGFFGEIGFFSRLNDLTSYRGPMIVVPRTLLKTADAVSSDKFDVFPGIDVFYP